jgi:predicted Rossmann fold nucleotide-binding protein DprA/Smf involved in DNA uptake
MRAALEARGTVVGLLADSLERAARAAEWQPARRDGNLCLATPYSPTAGFSVGAAMGRNRLIYAAADYAVVVASDAGTGGTWAGATEALRHGWLPVFVLEHAAMPEGNRQLLERGALPLPYPIRTHPHDLPAWLAEQAKTITAKPTQLGLF